MKTLDYTIFLIYNNNNVEFYGKQVPLEYIKNGFDSMLKDLSKHVGDAFIGNSELKMWGFYISIDEKLKRLFIRNQSGKTYLGGVHPDPLIFNQVSVFSDAVIAQPMMLIPFLCLKLQDGEKYAERFSTGDILSSGNYKNDIWMLPINAVVAMYEVIEQMSSYVAGIDVRKLKMKGNMLSLKQLCRNELAIFSGSLNLEPVPVMPKNWVSIKEYLDANTKTRLKNFIIEFNNYFSTYINVADSSRAAKNVLLYFIWLTWCRSFGGMIQSSFESSKIYQSIAQLVENVINKDYEDLMKELQTKFMRWNRLENSDAQNVDPKLASMIAKMQISQDELKKMFVEYNKQLFDDTIPDIPVKYNVLGDELGLYYVKNSNGKLQSVCIELNCKYNMPVDTIKSVLLHEMIHAYTSIIHPGVYVHDAHGWIFDEQAQRISEITGIPIVAKLSAARNITRTNTHKSKSPIYVIWFRFSQKDWSNNYKWCMIRTTEKNLESIIEQMKQMAHARYMRTLYQAYKDVHYVPCDEYEYVTLSRTFGKFHGIDQKEIEHLFSLEPVTDVEIKYE